MNNEERLAIGNKISYVTIIGNIFLSLIKFIAGIVGKSSAMLADSIHSLSDVLSTVAVLIGLRFSAKPADEDHPYGHEKLEPITSKILATLLFCTGIFIGVEAIKIIFSGNHIIPEKIAIYAAILSTLTKEWMYRYTMKGAKKIKSTALEADAWHHRSDALSSIGSLVGIVGARLGIPILDPLASLIICALILKVAFNIYRNSIDQLVDKAADKETVEAIRNEIEFIEEVERIDELKTRIHGNRIYVDVEISVNKHYSLTKAHNVAEAVHRKIEKLDGRIIHCMVHVNPY